MFLCLGGILSSRITGSYIALFLLILRNSKLLPKGAQPDSIFASNTQSLFLPHLHQHRLLLDIFLWGEGLRYTWWYSGVIPSSVLRNYCWQPWGNKWEAEAQTRVSFVQGKLSDQRNIHNIPGFISRFF